MPRSALPHLNGSQIRLAPCSGSEGGLVRATHRLRRAPCSCRTPPRGEGLERAQRGSFDEYGLSPTRLQSVRRPGTLSRQCNATPPGGRIATGELVSRDGLQCAQRAGRFSTLPRVAARIDWERPARIHRKIWRISPSRNLLRMHP